MSKYITNLVRSFKLGEGAPTLMVDEAKSLDFSAPAIVTATMAAPTPGGPIGVISRILDDATGIDGYFEAIQEQMPQRQAQLQELADKCTSLRMRLVKVHRDAEYAGSNPPKVLVRNFIRAKRGHLDELISVIEGFIDDIPSGRTKPAFTETTTGRYGLVTISIPYENAAAAEEGYDWVRSAAGTPRAKRMSDITEDSVRVPFQILHSDVQM